MLKVTVQSIWCFVAWASKDNPDKTNLSVHPIISLTRPVKISNYRHNSRLPCCDCRDVIVLRAYIVIETNWTLPMITWRNSSMHEVTGYVAVVRTTMSTVSSLSSSTDSTSPIFLLKVPMNFPLVKLLRNCFPSLSCRNLFSPQTEKNSFQPQIEESSGKNREENHFNQYRSSNMEK